MKNKKILITLLMTLALAFTTALPHGGRGWGGGWRGGGWGRGWGWGGYGLGIGWGGYPGWGWGSPWAYAPYYGVGYSPYYGGGDYHTSRNADDARYYADQARAEAERARNAVQSIQSGYGPKPARQPDKNNNQPYSYRKVNYQN